SNVFWISLAGLATLTMVWSIATSRRLREEREELARFAAVTEERLRIARDLHDLLRHKLSLIALQSALARRLVAPPPQRAATEISDIERVARKALREVREAVAGYRQPTLASELHSAGGPGGGRDRLSPGGRRGDRYAAGADRGRAGLGRARRGHQRRAPQ